MTNCATLFCIVLLLSCPHPNSAELATQPPRAKTGQTAPPSATKKKAHVGTLGPAYEAFRAGLVSSKLSSEEAYKRNVAALRKLDTLRWPKLNKLKFVWFSYPSDGSMFVSPGFYGWVVNKTRSSARVVLLDLTERTFDLGEITEMEERDYLKVLRVSMDRWNRLGPDYDGPLDLLGDLRGGGVPYHQGVCLLNNAYAAALYGDTKLAVRLAKEALNQQDDVFASAWDEMAWQGFDAGIILLQQGGPRTAILSQWQRTVDAYSGSEYDEQLRDYIRQLRLQVKEDKQLEKTSVKDPGMLPVPQRVKYYVARFTDAVGWQWSQPGACRFPVEGWECDTCAVVAIGLPAMPTLIENLENRRLTRAVGYWRDFYPQRVVLRVQDAALQCIEAIAQTRFLDGGYLSEETPESRRAISKKIKRWWKKKTHR